MLGNWELFKLLVAAKIDEQLGSRRCEAEIRIPLIPDY
jgi:hypothetical protein